MALLETKSEISGTQKNISEAHCAILDERRFLLKLQLQKHELERANNENVRQMNELMALTNEINAAHHTFDARGP